MNIIINIKRFFFIILILISFDLWAEDAAVSSGVLLSCQDQLERFGNGKSDDLVNDDCIENAKRLAPIAAIKESTNKKIKFYGYHNMIVAEKIKLSPKDGRQVDDILAGSNTLLKSITSLAIDEKNEELVILDAKSEIKIFTTKFQGNISPLRVIKSKMIEGATEVAIDSDRKQIVIYNPKVNAIFLFDRLANIHNTKGKQKLEVKIKIDTQGYKLENLAVDSVKSEVTAIDLNQKKSVSFKLK